MVTYPSKSITEGQIQSESITEGQSDQKASRSVRSVRARAAKSTTGVRPGCKKRHRCAPWL
jgi:hypothetical protein